MESNDDGQSQSLDNISVFKRLWYFLRREKLITSTKEEIEKIIDEVEEKGFIDEDQGDMIHNIIVLKDTAVREIMVPKVDMIALASTSSIDDLIAVITKEGCSRIPVYEESMDNIIGVIYAKDVLKYWNSRESFSDIKELMSPPYFVPEGKKLIDLLNEFRENRTKMAIVIDEYGNVDGLLTMGDIMEEIVGDIVGENDIHREQEIVEKGDGIYSVDPKLPIDEFSEAFNVEIPEGSYDTVGGFITCQLERIPKSGESLEYNGVVFEIAGADKKRISKLIVHAQLRKDT